MAYLSLTSENQRNIQAIIRSWNGKLTWNLLINKITNELEIKTTRQQDNKTTRQQDNKTNTKLLS